MIYSVLKDRSIDGGVDRPLDYGKRKKKTGETRKWRTI